MGPRRFFCEEGAEPPGGRAVPFLADNPGGAVSGGRFG